jgi:TonB family protein
VRHELTFALVALLLVPLAAAQQPVPPADAIAPTPASEPAPPTLPAAANAQPAATTAVYYAGPGVTTPHLIPISLTNLATGHCKKLDGTVVLSAVVDASGLPHNIYFLHANGNDLDPMALKVAAVDRFEPGTHDGMRAPVGVSIRISLNACIEGKNNGADVKAGTILLRAIPDQKLDLEQPPATGATLMTGKGPKSPESAGDATPPKAKASVAAPQVINSVEAQFTEEARRAKIDGPCLISLIVDANGMPQHLRVVKSVDPGLDQNALYAVSRYRFKPAIENGATPVPVMITIEVDFRFY